MPLVFAVAFAFDPSPPSATRAASTFFQASDAAPLRPVHQALFSSALEAHILLRFILMLRELLELFSYVSFTLQRFARQSTEQQQSLPRRILWV